MPTAIALDWKQALADLGPVFAQRAADYDSSDAFVAENYAAMREARLFSALVPKELGGGGASYTEVCNLIVGLGRCCGSTAISTTRHSTPSRRSTRACRWGAM